MAEMKVRRTAKFINVCAVTRRGGCKPGGNAYFRNTDAGKKAAKEHAARLEAFLEKKGLIRTWQVIIRSISKMEENLLGLR